jgi:predicted dehydrogenase
VKHFIIGLGSIGRRHAETLRRRGHEVVAYDVRPPEDARSIPVVPDLGSGWAANPDLVWICTPTHLHADYAVEALRRGNHVFIEKPVAHDMESARNIWNAWNEMRQKRLVWVGCNMRFHPAVGKLREAIADGHVGRPLIYRIHFSHYLPYMRVGQDYRQLYAADVRQGGGIVFDDIHDIDLALRLAGPVRTIRGITARSGALDINAEDIAHISLVHANGALSEIHMDYLRRGKSRGIEVIGEQGSLEWRSIGKNPERASLVLFDSPGSVGNVLWQEEDGDNFGVMFEKQLDGVLDTLRQPDAYETGLEDALNALRIAVEVRDA